MVGAKLDLGESVGGAKFDLGISVDNGAGRVGGTPGT